MKTVWIGGEKPSLDLMDQLCEHTRVVNACKCHNFWCWRCCFKQQTEKFSQQVSHLLKKSKGDAKLMLSEFQESGLLTHSPYDIGFLIRCYKMK